MNNNKGLEDKLIFPNKIPQIKKFYQEYEDIVKRPSFILEYLRTLKVYDLVQSRIIAGLLLARLISIDPDKNWVKNSDLRLEVGEYPAYYESTKKEWHRDKRFPIITEELMEHLYAILTPEETKAKIIKNKVKNNRGDIREDFAINLELNANFDYNQAKIHEATYYIKPQFEVTDISMYPEYVLGRFRVSMGKSKGNKYFVLRNLEAEIPDFYELNLNKRFLEFITYKEGLVLVTGPTGSGKSTTLAALINEINKNYRKHIITIEDPIEFVHQNKKSLFFQREVPSDVVSFAAGIKGALREKPDIIFIGELRDAETIRIAIEAAETGHLVFSTLHTFNAAKSIDRIINTFPKEEQNKIAMSLSGCLVGVISQTLVKKKEGGITALNEMISVTDSIRAGIKIADTDKIIQAASNNVDRCLIMKDHGFNLISEGIVDQGEILSILFKKDNPSYIALVQRLRKENLYDPELDPYSPMNRVKTDRINVGETAEVEEQQVGKPKKISLTKNLG